jgi:hypothetical protein
LRFWQHSGSVIAIKERALRIRLDKRHSACAIKNRSPTRRPFHICVDLCPDYKSVLLCEKELSKWVTRVSEVYNIPLSLCLPGARQACKYMHDQHCSRVIILSAGECNSRNELHFILYCGARLQGHIGHLQPHLEFDADGKKYSCYCCEIYKGADAKDWKFRRSSKLGGNQNL